MFLSLDNLRSLRIGIMIYRVIRYHSEHSYISTIILINIVVFFLWQFLYPSSPEFMIKHFLVSWNALLDGRVWTLVTSAFSHNMFFHLFLNVYVFWSFGRVIEKVIGGRRFLRFYLTAAIMGSLAHSIVASFIIDSPQSPALGASGAVAGLILLFSFMFPKEKIYILGLIPVPTMVGALIVIGIDLWGLSSQVKGQGLPIGHAAHLGGAATGIIYYFGFIKKHLVKRRSKLL